MKIINFTSIECKDYGKVYIGQRKECGHLHVDHIINTVFFHISRAHVRRNISGYQSIKNQKYQK